MQKEPEALEKSTFFQDFRLFSDSGPDGNRTRVQKPIPCPSTSVVIPLTFPLRSEE